ncbi:MAG: GNAT family N-acetyltransferase [Actinomycetes bacterium]
MRSRAGITNPAMRIRPAQPGDVAEIIALIAELAEYEKALHEAKAEPDQILAHFFSADPKVFCEIIESDGVVAGLAIWFLNYSTWTGTHGIYLEDLFVRPHYRGLGYGTLLLKYLAKKAVDNGYARFQWQVLDWNEPSIEFYKSLGAYPLSEWVPYRITGPALEKLAEE